MISTGGGITGSHSHSKILSGEEKVGVADILGAAAMVLETVLFSSRDRSTRVVDACC